MSSIEIRSEETLDSAAVRSINEAAFGGRDEADLIESLRREGAVLASLVAIEEGKISGHILFSRMYIDQDTGSVAAVALAPLAVSPGHQRKGIGGSLVRHGIEWLRGSGEPIVIVVGHPEYYPRFGFSSEAAEQIESPFSRETFMVLELRPGALRGVRGRVRYAAAFGL
jgi:putative acetyltransferase